MDAGDVHELWAILAMLLPRTDLGRPVCQRSGDRPAWRGELDCARRYPDRRAVHRSGTRHSRRVPGLAPRHAAVEVRRADGRAARAGVGAASNLSLLGIVRHMADVERAWFRIRFSGEPLPRLYDYEDAAFEHADPARAEADVAAFTEECDRARRAVARASLDDEFTGGRGRALLITSCETVALAARSLLGQARPGPVEAQLRAEHARGRPGSAGVGRVRCRGGDRRGGELGSGRGRPRARRLGSARLVRHT